MNNISIYIAMAVSFGVFSLSGCDTRDDSSTATTAQAAQDRNRKTPAPDNTGNNWSDVGTDAKTAMDQSQTSEHIRLTANIRRAIIADDTLSIGAKNCKIITDESGRVWLRGAVNSQVEKDLIGQIAKQVAGAGAVTNHLEIKST